MLLFFASQTSSNVKWRLLVLLAWFWAINLIFFPTWLFGSPEFTERIQALLTVIGWLTVSCLGLWCWLHFDSSDASEWGPTSPDKRQSAVLWLSALAVGALSLIPATYPLTSSGDERHHANMFQTIGQVARWLVSQTFPGPSTLWVVLGVVGVALAVVGWWHLADSRHRNWVLILTAVALIFGLIGAIPFLFRVVDRLTETALGSIIETGYQAPIRGTATQLVRFQPLSKFLWLPFSACCGTSLFALRLPALLCGLLVSIVVHKAISLRVRSWLSILPPLYLLVLPGMFYFGHVVYLTTAMLLVWSVVVYFYECYCLSGQRYHLILTAIVLNVGMLVRLETAYLTLGLLAHWGFKQWLRKDFKMSTLIDGVGLAWFGLSVVPLWSILSEARPFVFNWQNWLMPDKLFAIANDYPYHLGPVATLFLLFSIVTIVLNYRPSYYSSALIGLSTFTICVSYLLYTADYIQPDPRMVGVFPLGREWQTAHRFLVSLSPFVAILLAEGVARFPWRRGRLGIGVGLALMLLAHATVLPGPMTLPDYTSIRLRPNTEFPYLPTDEAIRYVSNELATPQTNIVFSVEGSAAYYLKVLPTQGHWILLTSTEREAMRTVDDLVAFCDSNEADLVVLPLVTMDTLGQPTLDLIQTVLSSEYFEVRKVFTHLGQPAIVVAEYLSQSEK